VDGRPSIGQRQAAASPRRPRALDVVRRRRGGRARGRPRAARAVNPDHRLRVEHDARTLLIHLSGEDGDGWTTIAVDRASRRCAVAQGHRQGDAAREACERLYEA
jgi:hypothetical protein